ncbi:MAG: 3-deoxy-D-manno-octulosonic acid transferase [Alphaproteobacteria bacterium]|nr:3-deoxy-D-manno-octulosonic acid transferase [Alphaproteobacteria bacterium]
MPLLLTLYQRLTPFLERGVVAYVHKRLKKGKEDPHRLNERFGKASKARPKGSVVWFHGASVGEAVSLLPLLHRIRKEFPHITPLVTTGTVSGASVMMKSLPQGCIHQYSPIDIPAWIGQFLDYWHPDIAVFVESEFWPNVLLGCRARKIPLYLVNAHLSEKSFRSWKRFPGVIKYLLSCFEVSLAQSKTIAQRLIDLGALPSKVRICGNMKFAANPLPYDADDLSLLQAALHGRSVWVAASTHDGEEDFVADVHKRLKEALPTVLTIISPRHPRRGEDIVNALTRKGLKVTRRSLQEKITSSTDIYVADTMGELGLIYRLSDVAFLGGTLTPIGGHNPIEAVLLDCALIWGPHTHKQTEICDVLRPSATVVTTREEFATALTHLLTDKNLRTEKIKEARHLSAAQAHILEEVMTALREKLGANDDRTRPVRR